MEGPEQIAQQWTRAFDAWREEDAPLSALTGMGGVDAAYNSYNYYEHSNQNPTTLLSTNIHYATLVPYQINYDVPGLGRYDGHQFGTSLDIIPDPSGNNSLMYTYSVLSGTNWTFAPYKSIYGAWMLSNATSTYNGADYVYKCSTMQYYGIIDERNGAIERFHGSPTNIDYVFSFINGSNPQDPSAQCWSHMGGYNSTGAPTSLWSDDRQASLDVSTGTAIVRRSDGSVEIYNGGAGAGLE